MKICTTCNERKPFTMFGRATKNKDGLQYKCKECFRTWWKANAARVTEVRDQSREEHRAYDRARVPLIRDKRKEYNATRYAENTVEVKAKVREYYEAHKEHLNSLSYRYNRTPNPAKDLARAAKRRATKRNATPAWADLEAIQAFYEDAKTLETIFGWKFHVDHIVPLKHPKVCGLHVPANLQILSATDNLSKHNKFNVKDSYGFQTS
jgi:hypothetical protein